MLYHDIKNIHNVLLINVLIQIMCYKSIVVSLSYSQLMLHYVAQVNTSIQSNGKNMNE